jgi:3-oxoacyl-[acyl-carrier-protein] synthase I
MSDRPRSGEICVVGVGARTPLGLSAYPSAAAVRAGLSALSEHPFMIDKKGAPFHVAMDRTLEGIDRLARMTALAGSALDEVIGDLPVTPATRVSVFLGLPAPGDHLTSRHVEQLCAALTARLAPRCQAHLIPFAEGNAAAMVALEQAQALIGADPAALSVVGGVDSFIDPALLEPLDQASRIASGTTRWGFPPGEGAGMLAVCSPSLARQLGRRILATIAAVATAEEPNRINTRTICLGVGLSEAMRGAAAYARGPISRQYCDINGERYRENELAYAILRLPPSTFVNAVDYVAPADCWGHTGAATGPLLMLLAIVCHDRGASPGPWPMIWCGSENGRRGAVLLHLEERPS